MEYWAKTEVLFLSIRGKTKSLFFKAFVYLDATSCLRAKSFFIMVVEIKWGGLLKEI